MKSILISLLIISNVVVGQEIIDSAWAKTNQTITLPTSHELLQSTYVLRYRPNPYEEPVSMLPLAVAIVLGAYLIVGLFLSLFEYVKEKK